jgi:hypothetical protein
MKVRRCSFGITFALFVGMVLAGCGENQSSICKSANEFQLAADQLRVEELGSALDAELWQELDQILGNIADSSSGEFGVPASQLRAELRRFIEKLEFYDYNLIVAAFDPETAKLFTTTADALLDFASGELRLAIDEQCQ